VPTPGEIAEVALSHIATAKDALVSFGQGCEGEPLMQFETIREAISIIRQTTPKGTINLNTNASIPRYIRRLAEVGLDSIRVSLNSSDRDLYNAYYRPRGYCFDDVLKSIKIAKDNGVIVAINLLVFPGLIDTQRELDGLSRIVADFKIDAIQMRNLSIDPEFYLQRMPQRKDKPVGILKMLDILRQRFPGLKFGYFNRPKEYFS
jgi:molybdenum cofactor biosynthesis enzyme MoaA